MRVAVEIITGRLFYIDIEEEATVESLKKEIASKESLEESRLVLVHRDGEVIANDQCTLKDCQVFNGTVIYLFFKPIEGTEESESSED